MVDSRPTDNSPPAPPAAPCRVSAIIKTFNEAENIARCIESLLKACENIPHEIIVADSLSADRTVEIAATYPVKVVQLLDGEDRSCGAGTQLGVQFARGEFLFILDGDMVVEPGFLARALELLENDPSVAGVGGLLREQSKALEFRLRLQRRSNTFQLGEVAHITGAGVYRSAAIRDIGYLTNRNLHCGEEWELGRRLRARGWRLIRLPHVSVQHFGDSLPPLQLLLQRWRTHYVYGYGELLKITRNTPHFWSAVKLSWKFLLLITWWCAVLAGAIGGVFDQRSWLAALLLLALGPLASVLWKRSLHVGLYSFALWNVHAAGLLAGLMRPLADPRTPILARVVVDHTA